MSHNEPQVRVIMVISKIHDEEKQAYYYYFYSCYYIIFSIFSKLEENMNKEKINNVPQERIIDSFGKSLLLNDSIKDVSLDALELNLDSIYNITNPFIELPIVKLFYATGKTALNLWDRHTLKNTLVFIQEFNSGTITEDKIRKYKARLVTDNRSLADELEHVLIILSKIVDTNKAIVLAKAFKKYVDENISWEMFCEISEVIDRIFSSDFETIKQLYEENGLWENSKLDYRYERLLSLGVVENKRMSGNFAIAAEDFKMTPLGQLTAMGKEIGELL